MNLLDRLLGHDHAATRELLALCLPLTDEQFDREFDAGWRTLRRTFVHVIGNIETWTDLMLERPLRWIEGRDSAAELIERLDSAYAEFAALARRVDSEDRWDALWTDVLDDPPAQKSFGGAIGHVITHSMHHRAEAQHMLHRLGLPDVPEGDLMGWDQARRLGRAE
ncbi:MAG: DinB family protein [Anaerolineae bacterium]|nr:MAG: DinB family protein [Anaerolineae bacterium]